jgi:hypothetical protein
LVTASLHDCATKKDGYKFRLRQDTLHDLGLGRNGTILEMNNGVIQHYQWDVGAELIGRNVFDYHQKTAKTQLRFSIDILCDKPDGLPAGIPRN